MKILTLLAGLLLALVIASGCAQATVRQAPPPPAPVPPEQAAAQDARSITQLRAENANLRQRLAGLEKDHQAWRSHVESQEDQIKALKDQKEQAEKERDRYKKQVEKLQHHGD